MAGARRRPPWAPGDADAESASFGAWLRRQREMREIHLHEIADRTKISLRYLQAMEQDRFDLLPAPVFARGFLREYAKYVGLSPDEVVNYYLSAIGAEDEGDDGEDDIPVARRRRGASPWSYGVFLVLAGILLVAVVAYLAFYAESRRRDREPPPPSSAAPPIAAPPAARVPEAAPPPAASAEPAGPAAPLTVTLDFTQECWVELVVDDRRRLSELHAPGESLQIEAERSVLLANVGNAQGVEVQVNGEPYPLPSDGRVVRDVRIELPEGAAAESRQNGLHEAPDGASAGTVAAAAPAAGAGSP